MTPIVQQILDRIDALTESEQEELANALANSPEPDLQRLAGLVRPLRPGTTDERPS
jgi:hypothetical protein